MTKFKAGDKVRVITKRFGSEQFGLVGLVVPNASPYKPLPIKVEFTGAQDVHCRRDEHENTYSESDLELVDVATTKPEKAWMVAVVEDGVFKPSATPKRHSTQAEAITEATRLASVHGGEYHVLKSVAAAARPVQPVTVTAFS